MAPHPDDIEIGAGATVSHLSSLGKQIRFAICTDGRYGSSVIAPSNLIEVRKKESLEGAKALGVDDVVFLPFSDGDQYDRNEMFVSMAKEVSSFKPDVIFAPDPFVSSESHQDHLNVGENARKLAVFAPFDGIMKNYGCEACDVKVLAYYMTAKPNVYVKVKGKDVKKQFSAIRCHESQFPGLESVFTYLSLRSTDFGLRRLKLHCEGFRAYSQIELHCLPECGE